MSTLHSATRDIISSQPTAQEGMSARSQFANNVNANGDGSIGSAKSGDPSRTAADTAQDQVMPGLSLSATPSSMSDGQTKSKSKSRYEEWYPGDASHDGRPAWWNRLFCCGYGLGCLLCPCSSWSCKHERS